MARDKKIAAVLSTLGMAERRACRSALHDGMLSKSAWRKIMAQDPPRMLDAFIAAEPGEYVLREGIKAAIDANRPRALMRLAALLEPSQGYSQRLVAQHFIASPRDTTMVTVFFGATGLFAEEAYHYLQKLPSPQWSAGMHAYLYGKRHDATDMMAVLAREDFAQFEEAEGFFAPESEMCLFYADIARYQLLNVRRERCSAPRAETVLQKLIKKGMEVNACDGTLLYHAAGCSGRAAEIILDAGYDRKAYGEAILLALERDNAAPASTIAFLAKILKGDTPTVAVAAADDEVYRLAAPDSVTRSIPLPDGGTLTFLFNFTTRQQIILRDAAANAPAVVPFAQVDASAIEEAAEALVRLGGDAMCVATKQAPLLRGRAGGDV